MTGPKPTGTPKAPSGSDRPSTHDGAGGAPVSGTTNDTRARGTLVSHAHTHAQTHAQIHAQSGEANGARANQGSSNDVAGNADFDTGAGVSQSAGTSASSSSQNVATGNGAAVADVRTFLTDLIRAQCELVDGVAGVALIPGGASRPAIVATHVVSNTSANAVGPALMARLETLAKEVVASGSERVDHATISRGNMLYGDGAKHAMIACPLAAEGRVEGACAVLLATKAGVDVTRALLEAVLLAKTFETFLWKEHCHAEASQKAMLAQALELFDAVQQASNAGAMGAVLCDELKRRFGCARASVSLVDFGGRLVLMGVSGADEIDHRGSVAVALVAAMEECAAQDAEVLVPPPLELEVDALQRRVTRSHEALARVHDSSGDAAGAGGIGGAVVSLPLRVEDDVIGVVTLEREARDPFPVGALALLRVVVQGIGPALWTRRMADRGVYAVTRDRFGEFGAMMVGPRHTGWKIVGALVAIAGLLAAVVPIPDRVLATARIEAEASRTVVPPFQGFLASVRVKPNDAVRAGETLAEMEVESLRLELARSTSNQASQRTQRDDALSRGDLAKARVIEAQIKETQATVDQLNDRIARGVITSPIDGIIGRGELDRLIGAPVEPTQALFEIVSEKRSIMLEVDERDSSRVHAGQRGRMALKSDPSKSIEFVVVRVHPIAEARSGRNVYVIEATLVVDEAEGLTGKAGEAGVLMPGMTGNARLEAGRTTTLARVLRPVLDEARLRLWW